MLSIRVVLVVMSWVEVKQGVWGSFYCWLSREWIGEETTFHIYFFLSKDSELEIKETTDSWMEILNYVFFPWFSMFGLPRKKGKEKKMVEFYYFPVHCLTIRVEKRRQYEKIFVS